MRGTEVNFIRSWMTREFIQETSRVCHKPSKREKAKTDGIEQLQRAGSKKVNLEKRVAQRLKVWCVMRKMEYGHYGCLLDTVHGKSNSNVASQ